MKVHELLTLDVEDLALGGKALAHHDGRVVFVDRGLPGDRVRARLTRVKRGWSEARAMSIEPGSPDRVEAPCPHFRDQRCGGCRFQDFAYPAQLAAKERQTGETLVHLAGVETPRVLPIVPAPQPFRYRNKMEFSFHPGPAGECVLGLHERGTYDQVFALETCFLPSELTVEVVRLTQRFAREHAWRAYHPVRHEGVARFLTIRHLPATRQCGVHLVAAADTLPGLEAWAAAVAALSDEVRTVTLLTHRGRANVAFGESERMLVGDGVVVERLLGLEFEATANAFLQTNSAQAERLYAKAIACAGLTADDTVLDLYCGTGTLTLLMARAAGRAVGVELVPDAVARAHANALRNGIGNATFVTGESRPVLRAWSRGETPRPWGERPPRVVVVDPPRAGLHTRVVFRVAELKPERVVYVSCNPATLARDVKDFAGHGYRLDEVTPFDLFPHTPHIEAVAVLVRG